MLSDFVYLYNLHLYNIPLLPHTLYLPTLITESGQFTLAFWVDLHSLGELFLLSCSHPLNTPESSKRPALCATLCVPVHFLGSFLDISGSWSTHLSALPGTVNLLPKNLYQLLHLPGKVRVLLLTYFLSFFRKWLAKHSFGSYFNMLPIYLIFHC